MDIEDFSHLWHQLNLKSKLLESPLTNGNSLNNHYEKHIQQVGTSFDPKNPKFYYKMSPKEYINDAIDLANSYAAPFYSRSSPIVGGEINPISFNLDKSKKTYIKIRKRALNKHLPEDARGLPDKPIEIVIFNVVENVKPNNIHTYYLAKSSKLKDWEAKIIDEFPENKCN